MLKSISTMSLNGSILEKLYAIYKAGFYGIEIFEDDLLLSNYSALDIKKICIDFNLKITLFQPFRNFEGVSRNLLKINLDKIKYRFDIMNDLEVNLLLVCSNVNKDVIKNNNLIIDQLGELATLAEKYHIYIGFEALSWGIYINSYIHAWKLINSLNHNNLGIVLDSFHILSSNDNIEYIKNIPSNKIFFVQIADAPLIKVNKLFWSRHYRCFPSYGDLNVLDFMKYVLLTGYNRVFSLEIFNDVYYSIMPLIVAKNGYNSFLYLENNLKNNY